jgi:hypothetical protein
MIFAGKTLKFSRNLDDRGGVGAENRWEYDNCVLHPKLLTFRK